MGTSPFFLALAIGLLLLAATLRSVKQNLAYGPAPQYRRFSVLSLDFGEGLLWISSFFAMIVAMPHPMTILVVILFYVSLISAARLRYLEEKASLNRWMRLSVETNRSVAQVMDGLADGFRSRVARQSKRCVQRMLRGQSLAGSVRRSKLPLDGSVIVAAMQMQTMEPSGVGASDEFFSSGSRDDWGDDGTAGRDDSVAMQQFAYVCISIVLAWMLSLFVLEFIVPTFEEMLEEFERPNTDAIALLRSVQSIGAIAGALMLLWASFAMAIRWLPSWSVRWVPWFGRRSIDGWRSEVLNSLSGGMRAGQSERETLKVTATAARPRWIRRRCKAAVNSIDQGFSLARSLRQAKLITRREQNWIECSALNGNLPDTTQNLARDLLRRRRHRWRIRMAWFVPLGTVLVGLFVLVHAAFVIRSLATLCEVAVV